jgi:hypothetical protein
MLCDSGAKDSMLGPLLKHFGGYGTQIRLLPKTPYAVPIDSEVYVLGEEERSEHRHGQKDSL